MHPKRSALLVVLVFLSPLLECANAREEVVVPAGNRHSEQPQIPNASVLRTRSLSSSYEEKYQKIIGVLRSDRHLTEDIKDAAAQYGIDPVHIVGALVGEHTYNISVVDTAQDYYVKALTYAKADFSFSYKGVPIQLFVKRPEFAGCTIPSDDRIWVCRDQVWDDTFRGKTVDGVLYENETFQRAFFQPFFAGQTFGLGQISPLTALEVSDLVSATSNLPKLSVDRPQDIYRDVMDPHRSVIYIAAIIKDAIGAYADEGFDISGNPGITATLYNLGQPRQRAKALRQKADRVANTLPEENYYGWLVNEKLSELRSLLN